MGVRPTQINMLQSNVTDVEELHRDRKVLGRRPAGCRGDASVANDVLCRLPDLCLGVN